MIKKPFEGLKSIQFDAYSLLAVIFMIVSGATITSAKPPGDILSRESSESNTPQNLDTRTWIDANRLLMFVTNLGSIAYDQGAFLGKNDGLYFPFIDVNRILNGSHSKTVIFAGGLWIAGIDAASGNTVATVAEYSNEYWPGPLGAANAHLDPAYRVYKLYRDSLESNPNQDYLDWPVEQGAPVDNMGRPQFHGNQTLWSVFNDGVPAVHNNNATGPFGLDLEIQLTAWAYDEQGAIDTTPPPIITVQHIAGSSNGTVTAEVIDPTVLTNHDYLVTFSLHSVLGLVWHLLDITIGDTVLINQTDDGGVVADGMKIFVINSLLGLSHDYQSASPLNVSPHARVGYAGGDRWYTAGEFASGGELLFGGIFMEPNFWGNTSLGGADYDTVEIRWRPIASYTELNGDGIYTPGEPFVVDDPSKIQNAFMYGSFSGATYLGFFPVPFTAWDVSDPANPRQLNVVIRDRDQDNAWNLSGLCELPDCDPTNLPNGGDHRFNYTWILGTDYDPTGTMYGDGAGGTIDFWSYDGGSGVWDAMWVLWLGERGTSRGQLAEEGITTLVPGLGNSEADIFAFTAPLPGDPPIIGNEDNAIFLRYKIINTSNRRWDNMLVGLWFDPDLGNAGDDLVGCDTAFDAFYCYNGQPVDAVYGSSPPAFAGKLLEGAVVPSATDNAWVNGVSVAGSRNLGMYAHASYRNGTDPTSSIQTYNYMNGRTQFGGPMINPTNGLPTRYFASGDPISDQGWVDRNLGDKRQMPVTGPFNFNPGDTQYVVWKLVVGQGGSHLSSIIKARQLLERPIDGDGDGVAYYLDNCPNMFNPDQLDADGNGIGNVCDGPFTINCGDVNGNGIVSFGDLDFLINFYFAFGDPPVSLEAADVNLDGIIDLSDIMYLAEYLNGIGPAPCGGSEPPPAIDPKKKPEGHQTNDL